MTTLNSPGTKESKLGKTPMLPSLDKPLSIPQVRTSKNNTSPTAHKRVNRALLLIAAPTVVAIFVNVSPASAFLSDLLGGDIWQIIEKFIVEEFEIDKWRDMLNAILKVPCEFTYPGTPPIVPTEVPWCEVPDLGGGFPGGEGDGSTPDIPEIIKDSQGEMGIPNPNQVRGRVESEASESPSSIPDAFEINKVVWGTYAGNQLDRDLTRMGIESVLGEAGQNQMKQEIASIQKTLAGIATDANDAQKLDVTQDVMKKQLRAFAQQSLILGAMRTDALQARIDTQHTNLNITNISRSLDEANRARRVEESAQSAKLLLLSSQSYLH